MASDASYRYHAFFARCISAAWFFILFVISHCLYAQEETKALITSEEDLPFRYTFAEGDIKEGYELRIKGQNKSSGALLLIVRIDGARSEGYHSRFNREFGIQSGDFSLSIPLTGLKMPNRKLLAPPYKKIIIFDSEGSDDIILNSAVIIPPPPRPEKVLALDFGKRDSAVFPGFEQVTIKDKRLSGNLVPRFRPSGDPLLQDGIEGIETFSMPWKNGKWKLSLWLQEQGEWEYLPHFLKRKIVAEGQVVVDEAYNETQWINDIYLAGTKLEAEIDGDHWKVVGQRRTAPVSTIIDIKDKKLDIEWFGVRFANYAAAMTLEPIEGNFTNEVEDIRKQRFLEKWSVAKIAKNSQKKLILIDHSQQAFIQAEKHKLYPVGKHTVLNLEFQIKSPHNDLNPVVVVSNPRNKEGQHLNVQTRYGHWRYERPQPNAASLVVDDSYLRADLNTMRLFPQLPRTLYLQVEIPKGAEEGIYNGNVQLLSNGALSIVNYAVEVLPIELPKVSAAIGLYIEPAPYYEWFHGLKKQKPFATACDLNLLSFLGFTAVAPALEPPSDVENRKQFVSQMKQLQALGFDGPTLAYAPLKRLLLAQPLEQSLKSLAQLKADLESSMLDAPYWSIYDEPTVDKFSTIRNISSHLRSLPLNMKTAGHLNNSKQIQLLAETDLAIMNHGYGVSANVIKKLQKDQMVWLYNMPHPRLAAGFYLWKSKAEGYLQWHGRMPTADPFDPTDGREGDAIYLYPSSLACPNVMNIHKRLLALHEATLDLRWLQWLDKEAEKNKDAQLLSEKLHKAIPDNWQDANDRLPDKQLMLMRQTIIEFARQNAF
ncbi:hypothetical protein ACH42_03940 [Endozoicomonas sp. (ex Bugula neritina AB1)]|nr:hypothetical protein ACH42_03940 [Endozoicomonas sp. (ex Bugula neritina AB1)]